MIGWKTKGNFLSQWYHVRWWQRFCAEIFKKHFPKWEKLGSRKIFHHFLHANYFLIFILLISNHTFFLAQLGINLHLWVFQEAEIGLTEAACAISAFLKTHLCKLIPNYFSSTLVNSQLVCLPPVGILNQVMFIYHYLFTLVLKSPEGEWPITYTYFF